MKPAKTFQNMLLIAAAIFSSNVVAYEDDKGKELCRPPKIQEFTLPEYMAPENKEVPPETEFSFVVSGWANPKKIKLTGKGMDIPFTVESSETFHKIKAKLPPELTGQTVRINTRITAILECYSSMGWLIKVADKPKSADGTQPAGTGAPSSATAAPEGNVMPAPKPAATATAKPAEAATATSPVTTPPETAKEQ